MAVLRAGGEALLLSPRDFPGSRRNQPVNGGPTHVLVGESGVWQLAAASVGEGKGRMWSAVYTTDGRRTTGCVAFDATRFSSEGDLASYLRWLVNEVYLEIPEEHRPPAFRLGERRLELTIDQPGFKTMTVVGDEGATLAARIHGIDGVVLVRAYPLDDEAPRFAVFATSAERPFWSEAERRNARFELVPAGGSFRLGDATARLRVLGP